MEVTSLSVKSASADISSGDISTLSPRAASRRGMDDIKKCHPGVALLHAP